jgi:hypothetical protein
MEVFPLDHDETEEWGIDAIGCMLTVKSQQAPLPEPGYLTCNISTLNAGSVDLAAGAYYFAVFRGKATSVRCFPIEFSRIGCGHSSFLTNDEWQLEVDNNIPQVSAVLYAGFFWYCSGVGVYQWDGNSGHFPPGDKMHRCVGFSLTTFHSTTSGFSKKNNIEQKRVNGTQ